MNFREIERIIKKDGWNLDSVLGSHHHYSHPTKSGKVTIPFYGSKDLSKFVVKSIFKQAQIKE